MVKVVIFLSYPGQIGLIAPRTQKTRGRRGVPPAARRLKRAGQEVVTLFIGSRICAGVSTTSAAAGAAIVTGSPKPEYVVVSLPTPGEMALRSTTMLVKRPCASTLA